MRRILTTIVCCCLATVLLHAQSVMVTFTGRDTQNQYVPLSRVEARNLTKGWQETLIWPDTVLVMTATGIENVETCHGASLRLFQNNPNPFNGTTLVTLQVAEPGEVEVVVTDITGRIVGTYRVGANDYSPLHHSPLQPGIYEIRVTLASAGLYFLTVRQNGRTATVKMVNRGNGGNDAITVSPYVETGHAPSLQQTKNSHRSVTDNPFDLGDQMEYVGFAVLNGAEVESNHVTRTQFASETIELIFVNVQPCSDFPTVTDIDGNVYNTVQIGSQCWMKENLRTTRYEDGDSIPAGTYYSSTEPYYYDYSSTSIPLPERGYLYNWPAVMHGESPSNTAPSGVQGICPEGWHVPSDAEWEVLTSYVSSQPDYVCGGAPGYIAKALSSKSWWSSYNGACNPGDQSVNPNDVTGFAAVPAGSYWSYGYDDIGKYASFWSSTVFDSNLGVARYFGVDYDDPEAHHAVAGMDRRFSVRCLRN